MIQADKKTLTSAPNSLWLLRWIGRTKFYRHSRLRRFSGIVPYAEETPHPEI
jgi:hypothetical protein